MLLVELLYTYSELTLWLPFPIVLFARALLLTMGVLLSQAEETPMSTLLLFILMFSSLSTFTLASATFSNAVDTLSNSGYLSMALTLQITSKTLDLESKSITIFAPSDLAFVRSGQMSLFQLQYHISPLKLSQDDIKSLRIGSRIPTLFSNHSLTVTALDYNASLSINGVLIQDAPLYDDLHLVMYGMDEFFNSSFRISTSTFYSAEEESLDSTTPWMHGNFSQSELEAAGFDVNVFLQASDCLISRGFTIMGSFLGVQLAGFKDGETRLTIFAPVDPAVEVYVSNITDYFVMFRRHVVPGLLSWQDLVTLGDGVMLPTLSESFFFNVAWSGDILVLNGVPVSFPDMFRSDWLVVHGLSGMLPSPVKEEIIGDSFSELDAEDYQIPPDYIRY